MIEGYNVRGERVKVIIPEEARFALVLNGELERNKLESAKLSLSMYWPEHFVDENIPNVWYDDQPYTILSASSEVSVQSLNDALKDQLLRDYQEFRNEHVVYTINWLAYVHIALTMDKFGLLVALQPQQLIKWLFSRRPEEVTVWGPFYTSFEEVYRHFRALALPLSDRPAAQA